VTNLEKRVDQLEQTTHRLEADRSKAVDDNSARRAKLESSVMEANASFDRDKVNNGTKQRNETAERNSGMEHTTFRCPS
jgi:hypothetical protein